MTEESLFHEALGKPAAERAAFLGAACAGRPELRAAVEALLVAHEALARGATGEYTPEPATALSGAVAVSQPQAAPGLAIAGRYTLIEKIGSGGMGEVWVAKQTEPVKRKVALKLIKAGMDSRAVLQRFEQERQALALMDHPHIARVLDGGLTPDGRPFFVMELVHGLPLTRFCDDAKLSLRERLELFVPICQAVQHAHHKGIVHRDLKPGNLLVARSDDQPVPKVIDFGVAKGASGKLTDESLSTQFGAVVGTLEYMAPEQASLSGEDIDTRADIYSLGVILYELLTGLRPLDGKRLKQAVLTEAVRIIREVEPPRPSARLSAAESLPTVAALRQTEPRKLMALLRGELDWVVMKCLEKDRSRRYETANGLARDLQRYLADEPVEARPPSARYRLGKFLRRHRGPVAAACLLVLALVGGIAGTTYGMLHAQQRRVQANEARQREEQRAEGERQAHQREAQQRARAEKARDGARKALDAMTSTVTGESLATQKVLSPEQKKFLSEVLTYYQEFAGERGDDEASRFRSALAAFRVGIIEYRLGRKEQGAVALRQTCNGFARLAADSPTVPLYRYALSSGHHNLSLLLHGLGKRSEAEPHCRQALDILEKLATNFPAVPLYRQDLATGRNSLGNLLLVAGKRPEALQQYRQALALFEELANQLPAAPEYQVGVGATCGNLGNLSRELGNGTEAESFYRKALAVFTKLTAEFPAQARYRWDLASSYNTLGVLLRELGKGGEAEEQHRHALALQAKLVADAPGVPEYRRDLASSHSNLGNLLSALGKRPSAEEQHRKALALRKELAADFPAVPAYREQLAHSHNNLGILLGELGKGPEAEQHLRAALTIEGKLSAEFPDVPEYRLGLATDHHNLGDLLTGLARRPDAELHLRKALSVLEKLVADSPTVPVYRQRLAGCQGSLGGLLGQAGKPRQAEPLFRRAMALQEKLVADYPSRPEYCQELAGSHNNLGLVLAGLKKYREAEQQYRQALALEEKLVADHPGVPLYRVHLGGSCCNLGYAFGAGGQTATSLEWFTKAIGTLTAARGQDPQLALARQFLLASLRGRVTAYHELGKHAAAVEDLRQAINLDPPEQERALFQVRLGGCYCNIGNGVRTGGKPADSLPWYDKAIRTLTPLSEQEPPPENAQRFLRTSYYARALAYSTLKKYAESIRDTQKALDLDPPPQDRAMYQVLLGGSYCNIGNDVRVDGRPGEGLPWFDKAIRALTPLAELEQPPPQAGEFLRISLWGRANAHDELQKYADAIKDWDRLIQFSPKGLQSAYRTSRAISCARAGQTSVALDEAAAVAKSPSLHANSWYKLARVYALASKSAEKKKEHAVRAMELLQRAVGAGYRDAARLKSDPDLDTLRGRKDFQQLVERLEKKGTARPEKQR
jgi:tetratricopeptide (TPR) repeat protein